MAVFVFWFCKKPFFSRFCKEFLSVHSIAVIRYRNHYFAAGVGSAENNLSLGCFAGFNPFLLGFLNAVVHAVADNMHNRVLYAVNDCLVHFRILTYDGKAHIFSQLLLHVPDNAVHLLEYP